MNKEHNLNEHLEFINIANELNCDLYDKYGEITDQFIYSTDGYIRTFGFGNYTLWNSEEDDRKLIEETNEYEDFRPFIINKFNIWIESLSKLSL